MCRHSRRSTAGPPVPRVPTLALTRRSSTGGTPVITDPAPLLRTAEPYPLSGHTETTPYPHGGHTQTAQRFAKLAFATYNGTNGTKVKFRG